ncbi:hypothetical protein I302_108240 [Kwoniella bestiolae CBS 10118]|uniref:ABC transporter domain-containing protein n=1 Tax=Kwoniella bestiolae CBS 10118 TaxID=1296100 RepID=A0A1B9FW95_9TREE|nr:hypothetical protein I302_07394 [Kwoniella bestiolae CBS 10118]OCF23044.1 hypothetical protein I302_07394 [Kwoniella bestiolae CBS 10118]
MSKHLPLVKLPSNALIHRLGSSTPTPSTALLRFPSKGWTIDKSKKEGWAVVGDSEGRKLAVETLLSRHRIHPLPPSPGPFPYLSTLPSTSSSDLSTYRPIRHLAFSRPPSSGEFTDYTARYGALQEEDKLSFRETLLSTLHPTPSKQEIERVSTLMKIDHLLDLPMVSFSSGQTRRSRIAASLLTRPVLLILEDPMAGLDIPSRKEVSRILGDLNDRGDIRIVLVLRGKGLEDVPGWVTDVVEVREGNIWIGKKGEYEDSLNKRREEEGETTASIQEVDQNQKDGKEREELVRLDGVSVSYGEGTRPVLTEVSWTIKEGEKWHLIGANGSGKTTLLSLILGHHPRSFSLPSTSLQLFSKPRREIPTTALRSLIGHTSPEIYSSFPRGMGLTAYSAVGTGFKGIFSRSQLTEQQKERVLSLLDQVKDLLQPSVGVAGNGTKGEMDLKEIALKQFSHFTPPQQGLLLFLRAIVGRPDLLILDEPSQGIDEFIWERCKGILEKEWRENKRMATIVVSHYQDEVPWKKGRGKVLKLDQGVSSVE